jgi:hypothetical protein
MQGTSRARTGADIVGIGMLLNTSAVLMGDNAAVLGYGLAHPYAEVLMNFATMHAPTYHQGYCHVAHWGFEHRNFK